MDEKTPMSSTKYANRQKKFRANARRRESFDRARGAIARARFAADDLRGVAIESERACAIAGALERCGVVDIRRREHDRGHRSRRDHLLELLVRALVLAERIERPRVSVARDRITRYTLDGARQQRPGRLRRPAFELTPPFERRPVRLSDPDVRRLTQTGPRFLANLRGLFARRERQCRRICADGEIAPAEAVVRGTELKL